MRQLIGHCAVVIGVVGWHTPRDNEITGSAMNGAPGQRAGCTNATGSAAKEVVEAAARSRHERLAAEFPYVLVMQCGGQSLFIENVTQRIAGVDADAIAALFRAVVVRVETLHVHGIVHGDLKLRNMIRFGTRSQHAGVGDSVGGEAEVEVCLCDLDAALPLGAARPRHLKMSTAYVRSFFPPPHKRVDVLHTPGCANPDSILRTTLIPIYVYAYP